MVKILVIEDDISFSHMLKKIRKSKLLRCRRVVKGEILKII